MDASPVRVNDELHLDGQADDPTQRKKQARLLLNMVFSRMYEGNPEYLLSPSNRPPLGAPACSRLWASAPAKRPE